MPTVHLPRLSSKEALILSLLADGEPLYGLQLVDGSGGMLKRGTVYVTLGRMEDKGLITSRTESPPDGAGGLPRRVYTPTPHGLRVFRGLSAFLRELRPAVSR